MDEFEFDRLIELYQKGLLKGKNKKLVDDWLNSMNEGAEANFSEEDQRRLKHKILGEVRQSVKTVGFVQEENTIAVGRWGYAYKIAASLTLLAVLSYTIWYNTGLHSGNTGTRTATSVSGVTKVILSDGTLVWLKGNSMLTYPEDLSGATRNVSLQGEALFEVAKDAQHPFIIQCGDLITTVLGTSFNIKSSEKNIEVVVLTGKVSLTSANDKHGVIVLPNEKVVYDGEQRMISKAAPVREEKAETVKDTEYVMAFEDTRMNEVIRRIEGKFDIKVSTSDKTLGNCMITADFSDQSLERTLSMISQALGFEYEISSKHVTLRGKGCD